MEADAESLWSQLQATGKERIKDLCRNPLRLTLLCATWKVENALPETMAELYEIFVNFIYNWKGEEFLLTDEEKDKLTNEQKDKLLDKIKNDLNETLGKLEKVSLDGEVSRFRLTHRLVRQYLGKREAKSSLLNRALKLGWLNEVGVAAEKPREKVYGFYHATFQEYFAALAVEDWDYFLPKDHCDRPVEGKRYRIFEPQWKQVILLWFGREDIKAKAEENEKEKEEFIRALVEFEDACGEWNFDKVDRGFYEYQANFIAAAAINEFKACSLADEIVRQVVRWGFGYFNTEKQEWRTFLDPIKEAAREVIPQTIRPLAIAVLIEIIRMTKNEDTRRKAVESLEQIDPGNPKAIAGLLEVIRTTDSKYTQYQVIESLDKIDPGNPEAIAVLLEIIRRPTKDELTRSGATWTLREIGQGHPEAIARLLEIIRTTEDEWTRRQAVDGLGGIGQGNPDAIARLLEIIRTTEDEWTCREAVESLGKI
ncbi:NACHT domain-containing protein [Arthrospira sp. PCC 8006]|uniref:NACHT domain-containing protein n=1 Tax=Arthrospira sp. PCC 8006 TaxID=1982224 RepID=UPI00396F65BC